MNRILNIDIADTESPTPDELRVYAGLTVNAEQYAKDSGATVEDDIARLSTHDLLEFRYYLTEHWGDVEKIDARLMERAETTATVDGLVWRLLQTIEAEVGGRWVGHREALWPGRLSTVATSGGSVGI